MSIRDVVIRVIAVSTAGLPVLMGGCVSTSGDVQGTRLNDNLVVYAPFDNERARVATTQFIGRMFQRVVGWGSAGAGPGDRQLLRRDPSGSVYTCR